MPNPLSGGEDVLTRHTALFAAREVLNKWSNLSGEALDAYIAANFDKAWHTIDVFNKNYISVRNAYYMFRTLADHPDHQPWTTNINI